VRLALLLDIVDHIALDHEADRGVERDAFLAPHRVAYLLGTDDPSLQAELMSLLRMVTFFEPTTPHLKRGSRCCVASAVTWSQSWKKIPKNRGCSSRKPETVTQLDLRTSKSPATPEGPRGCRAGSLLPRHG